MNTRYYVLAILVAGTCIPGAQAIQPPQSVQMSCAAIDNLSARHVHHLLPYLNTDEVSAMRGRLRAVAYSACQSAGGAGHVRFVPVLPQVRVGDRLASVASPVAENPVITPTVVATLVDP